MGSLLSTIFLMSLSAGRSESLRYLSFVGFCSVKFSCRYVSEPTENMLKCRQGLF